MTAQHQRHDDLFPGCQLPGGAKSIEFLRPPVRCEDERVLCQRPELGARVPDSIVTLVPQVLLEAGRSHFLSVTVEDLAGNSRSTTQFFTTGQ